MSRKRRRSSLNCIVEASTEIPITKEFEMLGVTVVDKLKFQKHLAKVCREVW